MKPNCGGLAFSFFLSDLNPTCDSRNEARARGDSHTVLIDEISSEAMINSQSGDALGRSNNRTEWLL
jgi:hypothetical protein